MNGPSQIVDGAPRFTVIMNVYNGEAFLAEAIDSVLAQTVQDWELILWDDCSTDASAEICARYDDPRIRYVRHPVRVSIGEARNEAIALARGAWTAFLDQDDIWLPDKLERQDAIIRGMDGARLGLVYGRTLRFDARGRRTYFDTWYGPRPLPEGNIFQELLVHPSFIALSSVVILTEALREIGQIPEAIRYCPDYYLTVQVSYTYQSACLQDLCCLYRVHGSNMSDTYRTEIHKEVLELISSLSSKTDAKTLQKRKMVHETWIGVQQICSEGEIWPGVTRILSRGSLLYLALRPLLLLSRAIRHKVTRGHMKYEAIRLIRSLGLLEVADRVRFLQRWAQSAGPNRAFLHAHPDFVVPPADLAFDAYNHVNWAAYYETGLEHARMFAGVIQETMPPGALSVLEWGCGPARILRHLPRLFPGRVLRLTGADYNPRTIAWCRKALPDVDFITNDLMPPLAADAASFDVIYNFSVLTHLSEAAQRAWIQELRRLLKPGGLLISTTHGGQYRYLLAARDEVERYDAGEVVTQQGYEEGKKWFFAIHPDAFVVSQLLGDFEDVRKVSASAFPTLKQDVWAARKPRLDPAQGATEAA
jgi:SAM-dependent methyltransferase